MLGFSPLAGASLSAISGAAAVPTPPTPPVSLPHLYWRVYAGSQNGGNFSYLAIRQLDWRDSSGVSLCSGGTAFASSQYAGYAPANAFPPSSGQWIASNQSPCWLGYQFASPVLPEQIMIAPSTDGNFPVILRVQWSDDGAAWTDSYLVTQPAAWVNSQQYVMTIPTGGVGAATAAHWLMLASFLNGDAGSGDVPANRAALANMRFLDGGGNVIPGHTDPRGTRTGGSYSWAGVWSDTIPPAEVNTDTTYLNEFGQIAYPAPVTVTGMTIQASYAINSLQLTPRAGDIWSSSDGMIWGKVWEFGDFNATGLPYVPQGTVTYVYVPPPPPTPVLSPVSGALPAGQVGTAYPGVTISAIDGTPPYAFTVTSGALPGGLTLDPDTGDIAGTPTAGGDFAFEVTATDSVGAPGVADYTIHVAAPYVPSDYGQMMVC